MKVDTQYEVWFFDADGKLDDVSDQTFETYAAAVAYAKDLEFENLNYFTEVVKQEKTSVARVRYARKVTTERLD